MEEQEFEACLIPRYPTACLFLRPEASLRTSRPQMPKKRLNNSGWLLSPREPNVTATSLPLVLSPPHFTHVDRGPQRRGGLCWQPREFWRSHSTWLPCGAEAASSLHPWHSPRCHSPRWPNCPLSRGLFQRLLFSPSEGSRGLTSLPFSFADCQPWAGLGL